MSVAAAKAAFRAYVAEPSVAFFTPDAAIHVVHPFNALTPESYASAFLGRLRTAFAHLTRGDYIAFGGAFEGDIWVTSTGYYTGHFHAPFLGIPPTGTLAHLRFGEFHKMEGEKAVESYIFLDLPELMIAAGAWPIAESPGRDRGFTGYLPGPRTQDGLQWGESDPARSESSAAMVTQMLRALATPDEAWRPYWHQDMLWYGPAAFGAFAGLENFAGFQVPFEAAFDGWSGGAADNGMTAHFTRFADGDYICTGGWPSLTGIQTGRFLGQAPTGKRLFMRVCDWWRREGDVLVENWVFVDIPHVLLQLDKDVFGDLPHAA
ncbi:MAG: nuclear transport factor 2 family protein [Rhodobacter sp.]|nr:nuclear transport factor 2 family protein [Rhodobacter sp.]